MSPILTMVVVLVSFLVFLFLGVPVALLLGGLGVIFGWAFWGSAFPTSLATSMLATMTDPLFLAIPLFIFMGNMLHHSEIGKALYETMHHWSGNLRGGLAIGTILSLTALAAMTTSGVGTVILGVIAIPAMLEHHYDKKLAIGTVIAGGMLGMLIVPSVLIIIYSSLAGESVGKMFLAALIPGLVLALLFSAQIGIRCYFNPKLGPAVTQKVGLKYKIRLLKGIIPACLLILSILVGIYSGFCTPTEAAGLGSAGALIIAAISGSLSRRTLRDSIYDSLRMCGRVFPIIYTAKFFSCVLSACGMLQFICQVLTALPVSPWMIVIGMMLSLLILCMFVDDFPVMLLTVPIFVPVVRELGFDTIWFGVLFIVCMNIAWLTPPYGFNLFWGRTVCPEGTTMGEIYRSVIPFIGCQLVLLALILIFPQLALWLPSLLI